MQDVVAGLWRRPETYDPERGGLTSWLHMRCRGVAIDHVRTRAARSRREHNLHERDLRTYDDGQHTIDTAFVVRAALASLPATDRALIELTFLGGLTYRAAAESLGIPLGTVKTRVRRTLAVLRSRLASNPPNPSP
ncbi:MAG: subfamily polymerase sigma-24 factor [Ilumatobacteraceae bacterium]|nr:subfamily polymerase sigma-24 factor [Ilumatobacteraceae bacterium]